MDDHGHGTAVAGIVKRHAPSATIVNVKVQCPLVDGVWQAVKAQAIEVITSEHNDYKQGKDRVCAV